MDYRSALALGLIAVTARRARQVLMPAINQATDQSDRPKFKLLHGLSVVVILVQLGLAGVVINP
jgi:hypothetical protein